MKLHQTLRNCVKIMKETMKKSEQEIVIKAPWGNLSGLSWGSPSNPPVILCHGKLDVCSGFRPLVELLPDNFYYVTVDLPGNGKSDHFGKGVMFSPMDFVPTVIEIKEHFKWDKFIYIGHSLGAMIGKFFNIIYPGHITKMVELDPIPAHESWSIDSIRDWYTVYYADYYNRDKFWKYTSSSDTAPKYTYEKAVSMIMSMRSLPKDKAVHIAERCLEPAGDGKYRLTFDQRMKNVPMLPLSSTDLRELYTATATPTLCILAQTCVNMSCYNNVPFVKDEKLWPNKNYKYKIVEGGHDVHISNPERMASFINEFLLDNKSKL